MSLTTVWNTATSTLKWFGVWSDPNGDKILELKDNVSEACRVVSEAQERAQALLAARKLTLTGSVTDIRAGQAETGPLEQKARRSLKTARLFYKQVEQAPGVTQSDTRAASDQIDQVAGVPDEIGRARVSLERAAKVADAWYGQLAQLNNGLLPRLKVLEQMKVSGVAPLLQEHQGIETGLMNGPGAKGPWDDQGVAKAAVDAKGKIDTLRGKIQELERSSGGGEAYLDKLRSSADARFHNAMRGAGLDGMLDEATDTLNENNPKIERRHVVAAAGKQEAIRLRFTAAIREAKTPDEIEAIATRELKAFRDSVATFAQKARTPEGQLQLQAGAERAIGVEERRKVYEEKRAEVADALKQLYRAGGTTYETLNKRFDAIVEEAEKTREYNRPTTNTLPKLAQDIARDFGTIKSTAERTINDLKQKIEAARELLEEKHEELDGEGDAAEEGLLSVIEADLDDAENFLDCEYDLAAAEPARGLITHAEQLLRDFDNMASTFKLLTDKLKTLETDIGKLDAKLVPEDDLASAKQRLADLKAPTNGLTADELDARITDLRREVTALADFVTAVKDWRRTAAVALDGAKKSFAAYAKAVRSAPSGTFTGPVPDPDKGVVKDRLDALAALAVAAIPRGGVPAQEQQWQQVVGDFRVALGSVWTGSALTTAQAVGDDTKKGTERAQAVTSMTGEWRTLTEKAKRLAAVIPTTGRPQQDYQLLLKQLAGLEPTIAKDPAGAARQLADIDRRLGELPGTPDFNKGLAKQIGQVPDRWGKALLYTKERLEALEAAAGDAAKGSEFESGLPALKQALTGALKDVRTDAFTLAATLLSADNPPPDQQRQRRAAKEGALRLARQYRTQIDKDPLFLHLQRNPFNVPVFGPLVRLLDDIEVEFLRVAC